MTVLRQSDAQLLRDCAHRMLQIADGMDGQTPDSGAIERSASGRFEAAWASLPALSERELLELAVFDYRSRQRRQRHLPGDLLGEPAWDMLLDLFIAVLQRRRISVSSACMASGVPSTTALRWLGQLERMGLVEREASKNDLRVVLVKLTDRGFKTMVDYYSDLPSRDVRENIRAEEHLVYPTQPIA